MSYQHRADEFLVTVRDENFSKSEVVELLLKLSMKNLTARRLVEERVRAEFDNRLQDKHGDQAPHLVAPGAIEQALNGAKKVVAGTPDRHIKKALSAFEANGFVLLVDDRQIETLDEEIEIRDDTVVTFLKLTPLVGG